MSPIILACCLAAACAAAPSATTPTTTASAAPAAGDPPAEAAPPPKLAHAPTPPVPLEDYFKIRRVFSRSGILLSFSHDEKLVAYLSNEGGQIDIWVQPIGGGPGLQITHAKGFIHGLAFSPTDDVLAYTADTGGNEQPHLFVTDSAGHAPRDITVDLPAGARADFVEWADDGKTFLYLSSARDPRYFLDRVQRPLLVVQGDRDARVKKDQSDRVVTALEARHAAVHYVILKDEGHGLSRTESLLTAYGATDRFLDRYIWGDTSVEVVK